MKKYYVLGKGYKVTDIKKTYPFEIWLDMQEDQYPIVILEGKGRGGVGGNFKPSELIDEQWKDHINLTNIHWLLPICKLAVEQGELLDSQLVLDSYVHIYGSMPQLKEFP